MSPRPKRAYRTGPVRGRLLSRVEVNPETECWEWTGPLLHNGYGRFHINGKQVKAHRASYEEHKGPIPEGLLVCHACDNRKCINPEHLWLGTAKDNAVDRQLKGRGRGRVWPHYHY